MKTIVITFLRLDLTSIFRFLILKKHSEFVFLCSFRNFCLKTQNHEENVTDEDVVYEDINEDVADRNIADKDSNSCRNSRIEVP